MCEREKRLARPVRRTSWTVVLAVVCFTGKVALAQLPTATVLGVVRDSTGAVIPGVMLTARNVETGLTRTTVSGGDGAYRFSALAVGSYEVRAEQPGFRTEVRRGLILAVGQEAVVNFTLDVGEVTQVMDVTAEAPLVNTTSGTLGGLVDEQRVADLPLNGRNYIDLTMLQTGVVQSRNVTVTALAEGTWFSSNGAPTYSNNLLLDGASMRTVVGGTSASINSNALGIEGIREFRVVTNSFSAEYGLVMGSQTMMVSKSGTNAIRGSLFEYLRNSSLDARNFFDYKTIASNRRLPPFKRNQFGGSVGGPIKKDKAFFHAVYEGLRERFGLTPITSTIPEEARIDEVVVPQISPIIKPWLSLFPEPNLPGDRLTFPSTWPRREEYGQIRIDQTISAGDTLFGRYTIDDSFQIKPLDFPQFQEPGRGRYQWITMAEDHIFSPALLNTARFSYSKNFNEFSVKTGISGPQFSFVQGEEAGQISIGGVTAWGAEAFVPISHSQEVFTLSDDVFYTRERHSLKFGTLFNRFLKLQNSLGGFRGSITFPNITTFLLGQPSQFSATLPGSKPGREYSYNTFGFYAQDDLRLTSNLTFNLGLRYEFHMTWEETAGRGGALRNIERDTALTIGTTFKNPSLKNVSPRFGFAWDVTGNGETAVRGGFGLFYDTGNLAGGFFGRPGGPPFSFVSTVVNPSSFTLPFSFPPGSLGNTLSLIDYNLKQPKMLQYNLTLERKLPFSMALTLAYAGSRGMDLPKHTEGNPRIPEYLSDGRKFWAANRPLRNPAWSTINLLTADVNSWYNSLQVGLFKRLSQGLQFQSSYTWSKTIDESQGQGNWDSGAENIIVSDPFDRKSNRGVATFDVTQIWRFNAIYRLPPLLTTRGGLGQLLNGWWVGGILSLNSGSPFSPVLQANRSRSGVAGGAAGVDRPDLVAGRKSGDIVQGVTRSCPGVPAGAKLGGTERYYDPCAFVLQPAGFLGNVGPRFLRGPGFASLDFSLVKDTGLKFLGESGKLEFRAEFFNILNRANFATPARRGGQGVGANIAAIAFAGRVDGEAPLPTAGIITSTTGTSRQIQFALKLLF